MDFRIAHVDTPSVAAKENSRWNTVQVVVLWRISCNRETNVLSLKQLITNAVSLRLTWSLKHVKHPFGDEEATENVDRRDESSTGRQSLCGVRRDVSTTHLQETTDGCDS